MCTVEDIVRMRKNGMKRVHASKQIQHGLFSKKLERDLEMRIQDLAEQEEAMSRYEHSLEVG
jgi:hypothetical protein